MLHGGLWSYTPSRSDIGNKVSGLSGLFVDGEFEFVVAGWKNFAEAICMVAFYGFPY